MKLVSQNAIGEPVLRPTPLSPDFDPLGSPVRVGPRHLVSAARYIRAAPKSGARFRGFARLRDPKVHATPRFRSVRMIRKPSSLRPLHKKLPEGLLSLRGRFGRFVRRLPFRRSLRSNRPKAPQASRLLHPDHPKAIRISRRSTRSARKPTERSGSVVGAGRDHPKSLSIPGHRRPHKVSMPKHLLLASLPRLLPASPFDGCPQRASAATHDRFARRHADRVAGHQCCVVRPARLRAPDRAQRGLMSQPRNHRLRLAAPITLSKIKFLNNLPIARRTVSVSMS
jgi:hypothetical protein